MHSEKKWNLKQITKINFQENITENVFCKTSAILFKPQYFDAFLFRNCAPYILHCLKSANSSTHNVYFAACNDLNQSYTTEM